MSFAIMSMARTGSTTVYRVLRTDPDARIAYEPDFALSVVSPDAIRQHCENLFNKYSGIKHQWDPNGYPFYNPSYISSIEMLEKSEGTTELNAVVANFPDKVVFLRRRDQFGRVISDLLGQQSNLWGHVPEQPHTESERLQYRQALMAHQFDPLNPEIVDWYMTNAWQQEDTLIQQVPEQRRLIVYYEDLFDRDRWRKRDISNWIKLASWIGVRPQFDDEKFHAVINPENKYNSDAIYQRIPNYRILKERYCSE